MKALILLAALLGQAGDVSAQGSRAVVSTVDVSPLKSAVRIRLYDVWTGTYWACRMGSGTIIHSDATQSIVLSCAHIFNGKEHTNKVEVDLFDGIPHGPLEQAARIATHAIDRVIVDHPNDLAVIWFKAGRELPFSRICPSDALPTIGDTMTVVGCRKTADPNAFTCTVSFTDLILEGFDPTFRAIRCTAAASNGRSGGGLFDRKGRLCGVLSRCSGFDDGFAGFSDYGNPQTIRSFLDRHNLSHLHK